MVEVETLDRAGSFIGYLFIDGANLSEKLVDQGLSKLHFTADRSCYFKQLQSSEEAAKEKRLNVSVASTRTRVCACVFASRMSFMNDTFQRIRVTAAAAAAAAAAAGLLFVVLYFESEI